MERALALNIADEKRYDLDAVLSVQGAKEGVTGKMQELVELFTEVDEVEAVAKGQEWLASGSDWINGLCECIPRAH